MRALHIFTFAIAIFLSVDALPYDKPKVHTIPLKPKSITRRRLSRRAIGSMPVSEEQPDVAYYGQITFGTGTPQNFDIQFDTGSGDLFVFDKNCDSPACDDKPKYDSDADQSFSPIDGKDFVVEYADGTEIKGNSGKTTIVIAGISVEAQEFGLADEVSDDFKHQYEGIMGMGFSELSDNEQTTPITNLINNNQLDNPQFSFLLGREADQSPSELTIGGSNPDRYHADTLTFTHLVDDNVGAWEIPIDNCVVEGEELNLEGRTGIIDTGSTRIILPPDDADEFYSKIPTAIDNEDGTYALPCEDDYEVSLVFSGKTWNIDPRDFKVEIDEDDCIGAVVYADTGSDTEWHIGSAFLRNVYTVFDQGNRQVGFAQLA
ncbi:aspartic peptidase domain-containing protein [Gigaspora rosea]|uniref:Aspartic peptidase domain-containing protein n=1 Tax=Gigaspora rosea TaxID=44941 RepID=A0A397W083_9GLOM|nr:aspartic peptidase domain-containing protein [Gigaspora rosea]